MQTLTRKEAHAQGYKSVSMPVVEGEHIAQSMERGMTGIDACWIRVGPYTVELARKISEIRNT